MRRFHAFISVAVALGSAALISAAPPPPPPYVPQAVYCYSATHGPVTSSPLCSVLPGNIGPDPELDVKIAYDGIGGNLPTTAAKDAQTPFDNLSWQTFVALNWTRGKENRAASQGLQSDGPRVWQGWQRVSSVFGNGPVQANCALPPGAQSFSIASDGSGHPVAQNEEYIQAATGDPAIDVNGNWTIYERRLNGVEIAYLKAPGGNASWTLTTTDGQKALIAAGGSVDFPALGANPTGAIEIKAAWRILDPKQHAANARRFYIVRAVLAVAPDLVARGGQAMAPICTAVDLGLVAMHIIQKNPVQHKDLKPQWFWSTFEHVDNAPLANKACDPTAPLTCTTLGQLACPPATVQSPSPYSYFNANAQDLPTNQPPVRLLGVNSFMWSPAQPFAHNYLRTAKNGTKAGTQIARCWQIYKLTQQLNAQWQAKLSAVGSVFANYMLVGTQWGGDLTNPPDKRIPTGGVPSFLSNAVVETYLQTRASFTDAFDNGSCVTCHVSAHLVDKKTSANLSFLPNLAVGPLIRREPMLPDQK